MKVQLSEEAENDLASAYDWYEEKLLDLGVDFLKELVSALDSAKSRPLAFQLVYQNYHRLPMRRFPYVILYTYAEREHTLYVYRVFHTGQNPSRWKK
tara:strand:+ start:284 stop:574 length:291 start_codon:yes stop_codon:yes gene_type:complete